MIIYWKENDKPIQTDKAFGFKIKHNEKEKIMWIPKSQIKNNRRMRYKCTNIQI